MSVYNFFVRAKEKNIDELNLIEKIEESNYAVVYKVRDINNKIFALKIARGSKFNELIIREFKILSRLKHPNIVEVYDYGKNDDGESFFTLEYIAGQPINTCFVGYSKKCLAALLQIIEALGAIHEKGFVHGDLKPEHIIYMAKKEKAVLIDFGFANEVLAKTAAAGTIGYIAPEVLKGTGFDARADLYSLGVIIYEIFTNQKLTDRFKPIDDIPGDLNNTIAALLSREPAMRPSIIELHKIFNNYLPVTVSKKLPYKITFPKTGFVKIPELFDKLSSANRKAIVVYGDAGLGKTRLLRELKFKFLMEGRDVLLYTPKQNFNFVGEVAKFTGYETFDFSICKDTIHVYDEVLSRLTALSSNKSIVIMADNIEDLSDYELGFFRYIGYGIEDSDILLIGTAKPSERIQKLEFENITIRPFTRQETAELLEKTFLKLGRITTFAGWLQEYSGGIPFFITELLNTLFENRTIYFETSEWHVSESLLKKTKIPQKIEELLLVRLENLSITERTILKVISLCNIPLDISVLSQTIEEDIYQSIEHLKNHNLLKEEIINSRISYAFDNMLFKQMIDTSINKRERRMLGNTLLKVIEKMYPEDRTFTPTLAMLSSLTGEDAKAYNYYLVAAGNAEMIHDYETSIRYYETALSLAKKIDLKKSPEIMIKIADINQKHGSFRRSIDYYHEAAKYKRKNLLGVIYSGLGSVFLTIGEHKKAVQYLKKSIHLIKERETREYVKTINSLAFSFIQMNRLDEAKTTLDEALLLSKKIDDLEGEAKSQYYQAVLEYEMKNMEAGIEIAKRNLEFTKKHNLMEQYASTTNLLGSFYEQKYETELARRYFNDAIAAYSRTKLINALCTVLNNKALLHSQLGEYAESTHLLEETLRRAQQTQNRHAQWAALTNLGSISKDLGRSDEALGYYRSARIVYPDSGYYGMAVSLYKKGDINEAEKILDEAMRKKEEILYYFAMALIKVAREEYREAENLLANGLKKLLADLPPSDIKSRIQPFLLAAQVYYEVQDFAKALDYASKLKDLTNPLSREHNIAKGLIKINNFCLNKITAIDIEGEGGRLREMGCIYDWAWINKLRIESMMGRGLKPIDIRTTAQNLREIEDFFSTLNAGLELKRVRKIQGKLFPIVIEDYSRRMISVQYLETLSRLAALISQRLGDADFIQNTLDLIVQTTEAERGALFIKSAKGMEFIAGRNIDHTTIHDAEELSKSAIVALKKDEIIFSGDALSDPKFSSKKSVRLQQIRSLICLPLVISKNVIGAIYLDSRVSSGIFGPQDRDFLLTVSQILGSVIEKSIAFRKMSEEIILLKSNILQEIGTGYIVGKSGRIRTIHALIEDIAATDAPVLITGETGTGKGMIARLIHLKSKRKNNKFLAINCGTVTETLFESELFGHKRGSFTGAISDKNGLLEEAEAGTVFLDEITNTSIGSQAKLLEAIEEKVIRRIGETGVRKIDVRFLFATNKNLEVEVEQGRFRKDLFYRINVFRIEIPPLRERKKDISLLATFFLERYCRETNKAIKGFAPEAMAQLENHTWPGNVRELQNVIERAILMARGEFISAKDLGISASALKTSNLQEMRRELIIDALKTNRWNITKAARSLGITRPTLYKYMKEYTITRP